MENTIIRSTLWKLCVEGDRGRRRSQRRKRKRRIKSSSHRGIRNGKPSNGKGRSRIKNIRRNTNRRQKMKGRRKTKHEKGAG